MGNSTISRRKFLAGAAATFPVACLPKPHLDQSGVKPMNMPLEAHIQQQLAHYIEEGIFPIIRAEAVSKSKSPKEMLPVAEKVKTVMGRYGIEHLQILQEAGSYPAVFGEVRSQNPSAPTILVQGHYDAQPSDGGKWTKTKPHHPVVIPEKDERRIYGRSASDDWGQVMTHIAAIDVYRRVGMLLPAHVKFLIEGGEEQGSKDMDKLIAKHKDLLAANVVMITDSAPGRKDHPVITTSGRGLVGLYVAMQLGTNNPHSGDNIAMNAVGALAAILTSMKDYATGKVLIPGFYDSVRELSPSERQKLNATPFDVTLFRQNYGLDNIVTEEGYTAQETMWTRPSYEVHTIIGGEKSNSIPTRAEAYVTMRIVPDQDPARVREVFEMELFRRAESIGVSKKQFHLTPEAAAFYFSTETDHPAFKAAERAMEEAFGASVDYMGCGGTEPIALYHQQILRVPVIFNGYNTPSDHYHGHDESLSIEKSFLPGIMANVLFYQNMARVGK